MTNAEIREFKKYVRETLINKYHINEIDAQRAVRNSYLSVALDRDQDYVEHDSVEEWADFAFEEINNTSLVRM